MYNDEMAISVKNLSKMYKVYKNKKDKVLDLLNIKSPFKEKNHDEFWALKDINLEIKKGEKLGIIGRNGAGKSTLLKIITGNITPTSGEVRLNGKVSALLELGTGFHPEFTGRENIYASLAYLGLSRKEAETQYQSIVEFSELEDFIDKPIKTYSAGMYTRLAFSVATSINPEILIIDEVLGAGDAYFLSKSIERMKKLTEGGTTVLFVSHDINSVQKMCSRAVWIDNGKMIMNGDIISVSKEYMYSIRQQEELRLRAKNLKIKQKQLKFIESNDSKNFTSHFVVENGSPISKHIISKISLCRNEFKLHELNIGDAMDNDINRQVFLLVNNETINWGKSYKIDNRYARNFEDIGGIYEHAVFMINLPEEDYKEENPVFYVDIEYKDDSKEKVYIEIYDGEKYVRIGELDNECDNKWKNKKLVIPESVYVSNKNILEISIEDEGYREEMKDSSPEIEENISDEIDRQQNDIYGSGEIIISSVKFYNELKHKGYVFTSGEKMTCRIGYQTKQHIIDPIFVVAIYKLDGTCITQAISSKDNFILGKIKGKGYVDVVFDPLLIGKGDYIVSVAIFKQLDLYDPIEPQAYDLHDRRYQIKVEQPFGINVELGEINHPIKWRN